jgi:hypothetical protein
VDGELRRELLARCAEDQRVRRLVSPQPGQYLATIPAEVAAEWQRVDEDNTRWLGEVVNMRGWPGRTLAGEDGAQAAWLLAQHADRDPVLQRTFLDALRGAVARGEAAAADLAYLEDRVRVSDGRPQLFGTPSSPSPAGDSALIRSRIRSDWTSAEPKPGWSRSLPMKPACAPSRSRHRPSLVSQPHRASRPCHRR